MHMKKERNIFMTKLWHSLKNKAKTIHELAKQFPEKTYRQLEKYRDADRNEEAQRIFTQQENEELKEHHLTENWEDKYVREHKLRQEAEGELSIMKGIETNRVKESQARAGYLQDELDRVKKENNDLHNRVAALLDEVRPDELSRVKKENNDLHKKIAALLDAVNPDENLQKARESGM